jgi:hypothetical protein
VAGRAPPPPALLAGLLGAVVARVAALLVAAGAGRDPLEAVLLRAVPTAFEGRDAGARAAGLFGLGRLLEGARPAAVAAGRGAGFAGLCPLALAGDAAVRRGAVFGAAGFALAATAFGVGRDAGLGAGLGAGREAAFGEGFDVALRAGRAAGLAVGLVRCAGLAGAPLRGAAAFEATLVAVEAAPPTGRAVGLEAGRTEVLAGGGAALAGCVGAFEADLAPPAAALLVVFGLVTGWTAGRAAGAGWLPVRWGGATAAVASLAPAAAGVAASPAGAGAAGARGAGASRAGAGGGNSRGAGGLGTPRSTATGWAAVEPVVRLTGTGGGGGTGGPSPRPMTPSAVSRQVKATTSLVSGARSKRTIAVWLRTVSTRPREPTG